MLLISPAPDQPETLFAITRAYERTVSETVAFRCLARADVFPWFAATRHPGFNRMLVWDAPADEAQMTERADRWLREIAAFRRVMMSGVHRVTGQWRGAVLVLPYRDGLEVGMTLHPEVWGRWMPETFMRPAIESIRRVAPETPIYVRTHRENDKIHKLMRYYGFETNGEESAQREDGTTMAVDVYRMTSSWRVPFVRTF